MTAKTFDRQTAKFLAVVGENMPDVPGALMQEWIEHPKDLQQALWKALCPLPDSLPNQLVVDCDARPRIPSGLSLEGEGTEHRTMGKITLEKRADGKLYANGREVVRYLSPNQQNSKVIQGHKLREELKGKRILNACILDALLANPELIPDDWKNGVTYFWGTIFRDADGDLYVEDLDWDGGGWYWGYDGLGNVWNADEPAACLADLPSAA